MVVRRYRDLTTWQLTEEFKGEVFRLVRESQGASRDLRFRGDLLSSARGPSKNVAEGFLRKSPGEFAQFLGYAIASIGEAEEHLRDGIELGYFGAADCTQAFRWAKRSTVALINLKKSQQRRAEEERLNRSRPKRAREGGTAEGKP